MNIFGTDWNCLMEAIPISTQNSSSRVELSILLGIPIYLETFTI